MAESTRRRGFSIPLSFCACVFGNRRSESEPLLTAEGGHDGKGEGEGEGDRKPVARGGYWCTEAPRARGMVRVPLEAKPVRRTFLFGGANPPLLHHVGAVHPAIAVTLVAHVEATGSVGAVWTPVAVVRNVVDLGRRGSVLKCVGR